MDPDAWFTSSATLDSLSLYFGSCVAYTSFNLLVSLFLSHFLFCLSLSLHSSIFLPLHLSFAFLSIYAQVFSLYRPYFLLFCIFFLSLSNMHATFSLLVKYPFCFSRSLMTGVSGAYNCCFLSEILHSNPPTTIFFLENLHWLFDLCQLTPIKNYINYLRNAALTSKAAQISKEWWQKYQYERK